MEEQRRKRVSRASWTIVTIIATHSILFGYLWVFCVVISFAIFGVDVSSITQMAVLVGKSKFDFITIHYIKFEFATGAYL